MAGFHYQTADSTAPAVNAESITPNNSTTFPVTRALFIGGAGNVTVDMAGGQVNIAFNGVVSGTILPIQVSRVYSTGTTATNILALY